MRYDGNTRVGPRTRQIQDDIKFKLAMLAAGKSGGASPANVTPQVIKDSRPINATIFYPEPNRSASGSAAAMCAAADGPNESPNYH